MYNYFTNINFLHAVIAFLVAQVVGSALAVGSVELFPALAQYPDATFEVLRGGPNLLVVLWFLYDMHKKQVDIGADFRNILRQITLGDMAAITIFNILAGLFSIYGIIYAAVSFMPSDALSQMSGSNGLAGSTTLVGLLIGGFVAVILAPPAEEFIFRGLLFIRLQKYLPLWGSMVLSSVLFAAIHFSISAVTTFLFALTLCVVVYKTQNIALAIVLHAINNGFVSLFQVASELFSKPGNDEMSLAQISTQFYSIGLPCLLGALVLAVYLIRKRGFLQLDKPFLTGQA